MKTKIRNRVLSLLTAAVILSMFALQAFALQETEDNDDIMSADNISVNSTVYGASTDSVDIDWYKFTTPSNGYIQIEFNHEYGLSTHYISLYSYNGTSKTEYFDFTVSNSSQKNQPKKYGLPAGTYYIKVDPNSDSYTEYNLKVSFTAANNWETESNDNIVSSDSISINSTVYGTSFHSSDIDWYKFDLSSNGYIQINFNHEYGKSVHYVYLYSYNGTSKKEYFNFTVSNSSEKNQSKKLGLPAGTYYVFVDPNSDSYTPYNFKVSFSKDAPTTHAEQSTKPQTQPTATPTTKPTGTTAPTSARPSTPVSTTVKYSEPEYSVIKSEQFNDSDDTGVFKSGDFNIYITNSTVIIYSYAGSDSYVVIPSELEGKTVVGIDYNAFGGTSVETVVVPSSVCQFGENAFGQDDGEIIKIICEPGSYAEQYAQQNGIDFELSNDSENPENDNNTVEAYEETVGLTSGIDQNTTLVIISVAAGVVILTLVTVIIIQNKKKSNQ